MTTAQSPTHADLAARFPAYRSPLDSVDLGNGIKRHPRRQSGGFFYSCMLVIDGRAAHATGNTPESARQTAFDLLMADKAAGR